MTHYIKFIITKFGTVTVLVIAKQAYENFHLTITSVSVGAGNLVFDGMMFTPDIMEICQVV
jgi:hypothetical protein